MIMKTFIIFYSVLLSINLFAQNNLDYYIGKAIENNPSLIELINQIQINDLQKDLDFAQNSALQISLSSNYLFVPYFKNNNGIITTNPDPNAIGYDIGITNGGLYSTQLNINKNIFNGAVNEAIANQRTIQNESISNNIELLKREITKQVTYQYLQSYLFLKLYEMTNELTSYLKEQLIILGELVESGMAKQSEYLLLSIESENHNIAANEYYSQYKVNLILLNTLCGIKDSSVIVIDTVSLQIKEGFKVSELLKKFTLDSLALQNQQQIFETKYQPQVSLFFNTGLNAIELNNIQRKFGLSAGINFSLQIFDGNQRSITEQQNKIAIKTVQSYKENFSLQLFNQRNSDAARLRTLRNILDNLSKQIEKYNTLIKISERELQQGQLSMIEYLTILKNYIELKKNKINADVNYQIEMNNYNYWNY